MVTKGFSIETLMHSYTDSPTRGITVLAMFSGWVALDICLKFTISSISYCWNCSVETYNTCLWWQDSALGQGA